MSSAGVTPLLYFGHGLQSKLVSMKLWVQQINPPRRGRIEKGWRLRERETNTVVVVGLATQLEGQVFTKDLKFWHWLCEGNVFPQQIHGSTVVQVLDDKIGAIYRLEWAHGEGWPADLWHIMVVVIVTKLDSGPGGAANEVRVGTDGIKIRDDDGVLFDK